MSDFFITRGPVGNGMGGPAGTGLCAGCICGVLGFDVFMPHHHDERMVMLEELRGREDVTVLAVEDPPSTDEPRLAHLVLKPDHPVALCGYRTTDFLGTSAPAMDRCPDCLRIAAERGLGRPGWDKQ